MTGTSRGLVLSGGGFAGGAWMLGLINGLRSVGVDLMTAETIIGTSAGARTAAQLATGAAEEVLQLFHDSSAPEVPAAGTLPDFVKASMRIMAATNDATEASRRIANLKPLAGSLTSEESRMEILGQHLPVEEWPEAPLLITAVDADSGQRVTFDRRSGVSLLAAVAASGALPGIYPLTTIDGRRYADGGVHSLFNADLAKGSDVVVVISPQPINEFLEAKLSAELRAIGEARVEVIVADAASREAMGANPASLAGASTAADAGRNQAMHERQVLEPLWKREEAG